MGENGIFANYFRGAEAVGGKLYFDDTGLTFMPHGLNIQKEELRIEFCQIRDAQPRRTLGLIPNGVAVYTKDGKRHKFVVYHPKEVAEFIRSKL